MLWVNISSGTGLTRVVPDKIHRAIKQLLCAFCYSSYGAKNYAYYYYYYYYHYYYYYYAAFCTTFRHSPLIVTLDSSAVCIAQLVASTYIYSHAPLSTPSFHISSPPIRSSSDSAITTKTTAHNNLYSKETTNSSDKAPTTTTNSNGPNSKPGAHQPIPQNSHCHHKLFPQLFLHLCT